MTDQTVAIIGNPNSGKTTLFNQLTGSSQKVGNWPGVTVDWKAGYFKTTSHRVKLVDLPGVYHLTTLDDSSLDERIAVDFLHSGEAGAVINTVDATNLERNLYLTLQLREMGLPVVMAVNMTDIADKRGLKLDLRQLGKALRCHVIDATSDKKQGYTQLRQALDSELKTTQPKPFVDHLPQYLRQALEQRPRAAAMPTVFDALRVLEGDTNCLQQLSSSERRAFEQWRLTQEEQCPEEPDIAVAEARYQQIEQLTQAFVSQGGSKKRTLTERLDRIVLNRFLGVPIFLLVMYAMFFVSINVGAAFQDCFDIASHALFVQAPQDTLTGVLPQWLVTLLASGVGLGINTAVTFIPVIGLMFLCLAFLEASGYMSRASFVVDRLMQTLGLPGRAFVPMIVGFGCNVPAVMAARTLQNQKDRILTILMTPFMSCGARLAIYAVFTSAFFAHNGANVVFALYLIGILMAVMTGFILRKTLLQGQNSTLVSELPPYHRPQLRNLLLQTWQRLQKFLKRAGKVIIPVCLLVGTLNTVTVTGHLAHGNDSALARIGQGMTPVFKPMGVQQDNWPATVGLATGTLAKEVVVATLDSLYSQQTAAKPSVEAAAQPSITQNLKTAVATIPHNLAHLTDGLGNPVKASAPGHEMSPRAYGQMHARFGSQAAAFAYLLFVLLYFPCVSTVAATVRELNRGWTVFAMLWTTGLAYGTAVCFYQAATWGMHPVSSSAWLGGCAAAFMGVVFGLKWKAQATSPLWAGPRAGGVNQPQARAL